MKNIIDYLSLPLSLPISPIWDIVICAIIGEVAYRIAFWYAGENGRTSGERGCLHWLVRVPLYFFIWSFVCLLITVINFLRVNWIYVLIVLGIMLLIGITVLVIRYNKRRKKE